MTPSLPFHVGISFRRVRMGETSRWRMRDFLGSGTFFWMGPKNQYFGKLMWTSDWIVEVVMADGISHANTYAPYACLNLRGTSCPTRLYRQETSKMLISGPIPARSLWEMPRPAATWNGPTLIVSQKLKRETKSVVCLLDTLFKQMQYYRIQRNGKSGNIYVFLWAGHWMSLMYAHVRWTSSIRLVFARRAKICKDMPLRRYLDGALRFSEHLFNFLLSISVLWTSWNFEHLTSDHLRSRCPTIKMCYGVN